MNEELLNHIFRAIAVCDGARHIHYDRTVKVADECFMYATGIGIEAKLEHFETNEEKDAFEVRRKLYKSIVKPVYNSVYSTYYKIPTSNAIQRSIRYPDNADAEVRLMDSLNSFTQGESFQTFMDTNYFDIKKVDPNAFIVFEFKNFDNFSATAEVYPFIVRSQNAVEYKRDNKGLQRLCVQSEIMIKAPRKSEKNKKGFKITCYLRGQVFELVEQYDRITSPDTIFERDGRLFANTEKSKKTFELIIYDPYESEYVQAVQVGAEQDISTFGETYVSELDCIHPLIDKMIKVDSEFDLVAALLAHPERWQYGEKCENESCYAGKDRVTHATCTTCKGEIYTLPAPSSHVTNVAPFPDIDQQHVSLKDRVAYFHPPVEIIKWQEEFIENQIERLKELFYSSETFTNSQVSQTATKQTLDRENIYDKLYPAAVRKSRIEDQGIRIIAMILGISEGLVVETTVDRDFKLKTLDSYLQDLESLNRSGAGEIMTANIRERIIEMQNDGNPLRIARFKTIDRLIPFSAKSDKEIMMLRTSRHVRSLDLVKYDYAQVIMNDLERENQDLYELNDERILDLIETKAIEILERAEEDFSQRQNSLAPDFSIT